MASSEAERLGIEEHTVRQGRFERTDYVIDNYSFETEEEAIAWATSDWPRTRTERIAPAILPGGRRRAGGTRRKIHTSDRYSFPDNEKGRRLAEERQQNIDNGTLGHSLSGKGAR